MSGLVSQAWLVVVVPIVLAAVLGVAGRRFSLLAPVGALVGPVMTIGLGLSALSVRWAEGSKAAAWNTSPVISSGGYEWFTVGERALTLSWAVDTMTAVMLLVVGIVAACVVVFSSGYMHGDRGWMRYFALLSLFTGSMNLLVLASSFSALFVGWELVGASSFLLIGFWYEKPSAAAAAMKAFLTTRIGDVGLLLGIAILWTVTGTESYDGVTAALGGVAPGVVLAAAVCLAIGAIGKSAQFPLHAWLPDAMEGPTPVSALIHAATMVAAGVFLIARVWPVFEAAPQAQVFLLAAGAVSALGAALVATVQRDIKKVLAYSTISQLGFMFAALGVGAWVAAFFHLVAHAAFKALLFLGSGSVIHGSGTQDLHEMGALKRVMPVTFLTWVVGSLALAGIFPLSGFFSKDAVLEAVWHDAPAIALLLFAATAVTAFYIARATKLAFFGDPAEGTHPHESPVSMLSALALLAFPALVLGAVTGPFAQLLGQEPAHLELAISGVATALALAGGLAGFFAVRDRTTDLRIHALMGRFHPIFANAYHWDAAVDRVIVRPVLATSRGLWAIGDRLFADGIAEGSGGLARALGRRLSALQTGDAQAYASAVVVGALLMFAASVWLAR